MMVSVIMLAYNHEAYIIKAIEGVLMQKADFKLELIITDDASTDDTSTIVQQLIENNNSIDIRYFKHPENIGMYNNFKFAYKQCRGDYIAICEGDDYWIDSLKLQKQVEFLISNPSYSFTYTRFKTLNQDTCELLLDFNQKHFNTNTTFVDFTFKTFLEGWHIGNQTLLFNKSFFNDVAFERFPKFKDIHLITQLLKAGKGACLNFVGAVYRMHNKGIHSGQTAYLGYQTGFEVHKEIYLDNPKNPYLRQKYNLSFINFTNANIREGKLLEAIKMSFKLYWFNKDLTMFLKHLKRIAIKALKK